MRRRGHDVAHAGLSTLGRLGRGRAWRLGVAFAWALAGCSTLAADGADCGASAECASGLCYANLCLDPDGDDDGDGLNNALEHALGSHPTRVDSDGDGKADGVELGEDPSHPLDSDGDGKPDLLESAGADADLDCLPDELDEADDVANTDSRRLVAFACSHKGVCADAIDKITATCEVGQGLVTCDYAAVPGYALVERCDGLDDDCDGSTDEGYVWQGAQVGAACDGEGVCGDGVVECREGRAVCSTNPDGSASGAGVEQCNGIDDDCDGHTDEDFLLGGLAVGAPCLGTGECGVGVVVCGPAGAALCSTDPGGPESHAQDEVCNDLDDDCDGVTDEGHSLAGVALGGDCPGIGACGAGKVVCGGAGVAICSTDPGGPDDASVAEVCNGLDDNCNGSTDEGFAWQGAAIGADCVGTGTCGAGKVVCSVLGKATCSSMPDAPGATPVQELCNGLDDDCDGATDDGLSWQGAALGAACAGVGACGAGVVECAADGQTTCSTLANGSAAQAAAEQCNNLDDDCDGLTDEDADSAGAPVCAPVGVCIGGTGEPVCTAGAWGCAWPGVAGWQSPDEATCDGKDNDCDGSTDEGLAKTFAASPTSSSAGWPQPRRNAALTADATGMWLAAGLVRGADGATQNIDDLWHLDPLTGQAKLVAREGALARSSAALAFLPAGWVGKQAVLWLLGGVSSSGAPANQPLQIDPQTGAISSLPMALAPEHRVGAVALVDGKAGMLWLLGGADAGGVSVQRFDASNKIWAAQSAVPQPSTQVVGRATGCLAANGTLWMRGQDATGAWRLWSLAPSAAEWIDRTVPMAGGEVHGGTLLCDVATGEHWLLGAAVSASADAAAAGLRRYDVASATWSAPSVDPSPQRVAPLVGRHGAGVISVLFGRVATGIAASLFRSQTGTWTEVMTAPAPALGVAAFASSSRLVVAGGHELRDGAVVAAPIWRYGSKGWESQAWPATVPARLAPLMVYDPVGDRGIGWGGRLLGKSWPTLTPGAKPDIGAFVLPSSGGSPQALDAGAAAKLPAVRIGALTSIAATAGAPVHVLGLGAAGLDDGSDAKLELWRVEPSKLTATLLESGLPSALGWTASGVLWQAPAGDAVRYVSPMGALTFWRWSKGAGWTKEAADPSIGSGRVVLIEGSGGSEALVVVLPPDGGSAQVRRAAQVGGVLQLQNAAPVTLPFSGLGAVVWQPAAARNLLFGPEIAGLPRAELSIWAEVCDAP
ncbi:MAG: hypothetical protein RIT45_1959 [Pseudomonadota bacterium]